jgi:CBS domain-containing protein
MSNAGSEPEVPIENVMSRPVVTIRDGATVTAAAKLMKKHDIGSVVVTNRKGQPIGLITERDVVRRVAASGLSPGKVRVAKAMTKPLATVKASMSVTEAAKLMKSRKIRRLAVMKENQLVGMVTSNDIVDITPALIDVLTEKSRIAPLPTQRESKTLAGYCDECGSWSDDLKPTDGRFLCPDCLADLKTEVEEI